MRNTDLASVVSSGNLGSSRTFSKAIDNPLSLTPTVCKIPQKNIKEAAVKIRAPNTLLTREEEVPSQKVKLVQIMRLKGI